MIGHVLMFKLQEPIEDSKAAVISVLEPLGDGRIPSVVSLRLHANITESRASWDLIMVATLTDEDGLKAYLEHPAHLSAAERLVPHISGAALVDYAMQ